MAARAFGLIPLCLAAIVCGAAAGGGPLRTIAFSGDFPPDTLVAGHAGDMWIGPTGGDGKVEVVRAGGSTASFGAPVAGTLVGMTMATDGSVWLSTSSGFLQFSPTLLTRIGADGTTHAVAATGLGLDKDYAAGPVEPGPTGNVWFDADNGRIAEISPAGSVLHVYTPLGGGAHLVAADSSGDVWLSVFSTHATKGRLALMNAAGSVLWQTNVLAAVDCCKFWEALPALDGSLWLTDGASLSRISTHGVVQPFPTSPSLAGSVDGMALDAAGTLWLAMSNPSAIVSVTPDGRATSYAQTVAPALIAVGSDGTLWFGGAVGKRFEVFQTPVPPPVVLPAPVCVVPDVTGEALGAAQAAVASAANCKPGTVAGARNGVVWGETPLPGKHIAPGSTVNLLLGRGSPTLPGLWQGSVTTDQCDENGGTTPSGENYSTKLTIAQGPGGKLAATFGGSRLSETKVKGKTTSFAGKHVALSVKLDDASSVSAVFSRYGYLGCGEVDTYGSLSRTAGP
jgi:streptogramin lyase